MKTLTLKLPEVLEAKLNIISRKAGNILKLLERQLLSLPFRLEGEISAIKELLYKYKNLPMSLADACLVRMSEQITDSVIFTLA